MFCTDSGDKKKKNVKDFSLNSNVLYMNTAAKFIN